MKYLFYLTFLVAGLIGLWSCNEDVYVDPVQLTTIRGRVLYSDTQQPVINATIKLSPTSRIITTDSTGSFRLDSVVAGKYTVQVTKTNYGSESVTVETTTTNPVPPIVTILLSKESVINSQPTSPTLVTPANNSTMQSTTLTLKWSATDPNRDTLRYDVVLFRAGSTTPTFSFTGLKADSLTVSLAYNSTYVWQVIVKDGITAPVNGPLWTFTTMPPPDYKFVYVRRVGGNYQIFASNETGDVSQLTRDGSNWRPIVSPNRRQIAYISNVNTDLHLFVMNMDGSNAYQVSTAPIAGVDPSDLSFCWSPDGSQLLYPSNDRLYSVYSNGTGLMRQFQAYPGRTIAGCDWTSQGNLIVFRSTGTNAYDNEIATISPNSSNGNNNGNFLYSSRTRRIGNPVFSITGRTVLFTVDTSGFQNEQYRQLDARIYTLDLATKRVAVLGTNTTSTGGSTQTGYSKPAGTNDLDPRFSPTGAQIIFTNTDNTGFGVRSVYITDLNGSGRTLLFTGAEMPYWR